MYLLEYPSLAIFVCELPLEIRRRLGSRVHAVNPVGNQPDTTSTDKVGTVTRRQPRRRTGTRIAFLRQPRDRRAIDTSIRRKGQQRYQIDNSTHQSGSSLSRLVAELPRPRQLQVHHGGEQLGRLLGHRGRWDQWLCEPGQRKHGRGRTWRRSECSSRGPGGKAAHYCRCELGCCNENADVRTVQPLWYTYHSCV